MGSRNAAGCQKGVYLACQGLAVSARQVEVVQRKGDNPHAPDLQNLGQGRSQRRLATALRTTDTHDEEALPLGRLNSGRQGLNDGLNH